MVCKHCLSHSEKTLCCKCSPTHSLCQHLLCTYLWDTYYNSLQNSSHGQFGKSQQNKDYSFLHLRVHIQSEIYLRHKYCKRFHLAQIDIGHDRTGCNLGLRSHSQYCTRLADTARTWKMMTFRFLSGMFLRCTVHNILKMSCPVQFGTCRYHTPNTN